MEMKIMYSALVFIVGWFYFYICLRQLIFDFTVGYPLINRFGNEGPEVFAPKGAHRLNTISVMIWLVICIGLGFVAFYFFAIYLKISFGIGALTGVLAYLNKLSPATRSNFDAFCHTYCRFVPDDDLRQAMSNADIAKMHSNLHKLGSKLKFEFKN